MRRKILKYYYNELGKPLYCILIKVDEYDCTCDDDCIVDCNITFSFPFFSVYDYPHILSRYNDIIRVLLDNPDANINRLLSELEIAIEQYAELKYLYIPELLISNSNQVKWRVFKAIIGDYLGSWPWEHFVSNYSDSLGEEVVYSNGHNKYLFNLCNYLLIVKKREFELFESNLSEFINSISSESQDIILDDYSPKNKYFRCFYQNENSQGYMYSIIDSKGDPVLYCCIDD